jgi:hypothetical protein
MRRFTRSFCAFIAIMLAAAVTRGAELTNGAVLGTVLTTAGKPLSGALVSAVAPTGRYSATTDAGGRFTILGLSPDTYLVRVELNGYELSTMTVVVLPGAHELLRFTLRPSLKEIAQVRAKNQAFTIGSAADVFTVAGEQAQAANPQASSSGLANYSRDTIQRAISNVPGVQQDSFANVIVRGGKVQDTVYDYDSVPVPQGLIAEPGGNIVGAGSLTVSSVTYPYSRVRCYDRLSEDFWNDRDGEMEPDVGLCGTLDPTCISRNASSLSSVRRVARHADGGLN